MITRQTNEYYICEEFKTLAGPYNKSRSQSREHLENVINDMKRGNINYKIVGSDSKCYVQRTGMILPKES